MNIMKDCLYTKEHEWVKVDGDKVRIGITDFAQHALGDIVFVELPELETELTEGDSMGAVESVKAASDIYSPVTGIVLEVNEAVTDDPSLLNQDAFENWLVCVQLSDKAELNELMDVEAYEVFCSKEA